MVFGLSIAFTAGWMTILTVFLLSRKYWTFAVTFILGLVWLLYSPSILVWIEHLGSDSFSEAQNFDLVEALNFLESLNQVARRESFSKTGLTIGLGFLLATVAYTVPALLLRRRDYFIAKPMSVLAGAVMVGSLSFQIYPAFSAFQSNSALYRKTTENFHEHPGAKILLRGAVNDLKVVVYIGESTTVLNMSIYGYPRQTTPELNAFQSNNDGFLLFYNVFATHVHTAPSLLEALSVGIDPSEEFFPIKNRTRTSIVDLLKQAGIASTLISNQGRSGTWNNLASTVVFRNIGDKEFSFNSVWLGELEHRASRPLDHQYLGAALDRHGILRRQGPEIAFLHSYAGHGPYLRNISEEFKAPVDAFMRKKPAVTIVGDQVADPNEVVKLVEQYDSMVTYVDHSIVSIMQRVKASQLPSVFVYFSDHGEAVYAGRRHDSSRFLHEMARVPFFVYFNEAAAHRYPDIYELFRKASSEQKISTLAQLPASLLWLFGLEVEGGLYKGVGLDDVEALPPILTRETGAGYSFMRIGTRTPQGGLPVRPRDVTDATTALFRATQQFQHRDTQLCQHRSNTIGKALRGALVADCLWVDVAIGEDNSPKVHPSPTVPAGLDLEAVIEVARGYDLSLWLVGSDLNSAADCKALDAFFERRTGGTPREVLVMFPSNTPWNDAGILDCTGSLQSKGFRTAFEVPLDIAKQCTDSLAKGIHDEASCTALSSIIKDVAGSGAFTDFGADISVAVSIERSVDGTGLSWDTWGVKVGQIEEIQSSRFRMVALDSLGDPNDR